MYTFKARLLHILVIVCLLAVLPASRAQAASTIYRVKPGGLTSGACGSTWTSTCSLQRALSLAGAGDQLWVKAGTYKPTADADRGVSFALENGVALYGGFAGTEATLSLRSPTANVTILSGDIGIAGNTNDNSYHVVVGSGTDNTAVLDGFTITAGNSDGSGVGGAGYGDGGGMLILDGSPTLRNIVFSNNRTGSYGSGGGLKNTGDPTLTNIIFSDNYGSIGGGMSTTVGSPVLTNVTFSGNTSANGGALDHTGSATLINVTFAGNTASNYGGAIYNSGSGLTLKNVTISGNQATTFHGGGLYNHAGTPVLINTILWGNTAPLGSGPQVYNDAGGAANISYSVVQGGYVGGTNIVSDDPELDALRNNGGFTQTLRLLPGSSAINAGNDAVGVCPSADQRGIARPQSTHCDIGAYEYETGTRYVKSGATGANTGTSWTDAYTDLQSALAAAISGDTVWVASGTYKPTTGFDRTISFFLQSGVTIYGGFAGAETALEQRNWNTNVTILSGDIGTPNNNSDNSHHVVASGATDVNTVLDGFTVTGGNANVSVADYSYGGGIYITGSPTLTNVTLSNNSAISGGGIYNLGGDPALTNVAFNGNSTSTSGSGGGMYNSGGNPTLTDVTFSNNSVGASGYGGGMFNDYGSPILQNVAFSNNFTGASGSGGGMYDAGGSPTLTDVTFNSNSATGGGGMYNDPGGIPALTNVTFDNNSAANGAGIFNNGDNMVLTNVTFNGNAASLYGGGLYNPAGTPTLTNVTFKGNTAFNGGGMMVDNGNPLIRNAILWGNSPQQIYGNVAISYSVVQGGYGAGTNIITTDPQLGTLGDHGGFTQTIPLQFGSSAIDTGTNTNCPDEDQRGLVRPQDGNKDSDPVCDIGAYESAPGVGMYDDVDSGWTYSTGWTASTATGPYGGTFHRTNVKGSTATFMFQGPAFFTFYYRTGTNRGSFEIWVDGARVKTINAYNTTTTWQKKYNSRAYADNRAHTVMIKNISSNGTYVDVDAININLATLPAGPGTYDDIHPLWIYSSGWTAKTTASGPLDGTFHLTSTKGKTATFIFQAPGHFVFYYRKGTNRGSFEIWVDGMLLRTINAYSTTTVWQKKYTSPLYGDTKYHQVVIKNTSPDGTYIDVDAIEIIAP